MNIENLRLLVYAKDLVSVVNKRKIKRMKKFGAAYDKEASNCQCGEIKNFSNVVINNNDRFVIEK